MAFAAMPFFCDVTRNVREAWDAAASSRGKNPGSQLQHHALASPRPNAGVVAVRGSVVDARFDGRLPAIHSVLKTGADGKIVIEALAQRDARHVRGIALTPTQGLARGMAVEDTGAPLPATVGPGILSRMFDVF